MAESDLEDTEQLDEEVLEEEYQQLDPHGQELADLLKQFGVSLEVAGAFITNKYTLQTLRIIECREIEELIPAPFLAERTKFIYGLNQWRCSQDFRLFQTLPHRSK